MSNEEKKIYPDENNIINDENNIIDKENSFLLDSDQEINLDDQNISGPEFYSIIKKLRANINNIIKKAMPTVAERYLSDLDNLVSLQEMNLINPEKLTKNISKLQQEINEQTELSTVRFFPSTNPAPVIGMNSDHTPYYTNESFKVFYEKLKNPENISKDELISLEQQLFENVDLCYKKKETININLNLFEDAINLKVKMKYVKELEKVQIYFELNQREESKEKLLDSYYRSKMANIGHDINHQLQLLSSLFSFKEKGNNSEIEKINFQYEKGENSIIFKDPKDLERFLKYLKNGDKAFLNLKNFCKETMDEVKNGIKLKEKTAYEFQKLYQAFVSFNIQSKITKLNYPEFKSTNNLMLNDKNITSIIPNLLTNAEDSFKEYNKFIKFEGDKEKSPFIINMKTEDVLLSESDLVSYILKYELSKNLLPGNYTRISFTDNGIGINKDIMEKIGTLGVTTKKNKEGLIGGNGVGLNGMKNIIDEHCGFLIKSSNSLKDEILEKLAMNLQQKTELANKECDVIDFLIKNKFDPKMIQSEIKTATTFDIYLPSAELFQDIKAYREAKKEITSKMKESDPDIK